MRERATQPQPTMTPDGKVIVYVRPNSHKATLDCPGVLVSHVDLPLTRQRREQFARTSRRQARRKLPWMDKTGNFGLKPELTKRLGLISSTKGNPVVLFQFVTTDMPKNFDIAGQPTFEEAQKIS